jgi:phosphorylcholine metabolism protein LicD
MSNLRMLIIAILLATFSLAAFTQDQIDPLRYQKKFKKKQMRIAKEKSRAIRNAQKLQKKKEICLSKSHKYRWTGSKCKKISTVMESTDDDDQEE